MGGDFVYSSGIENMLRVITGILFLTSCSFGIVKKGGKDPYLYDPKSDYTFTQLNELSSKVVETSQRDPITGKLSELFGKFQTPIKRIGILIFESEIQPTRDGLAGKNLVYLNEAGKQILTENFLNIWEQSIKLMGPDLNYVPVSKIKKSASYDKYGLFENDYVKSKRYSVAPDDIFYLESGRKTTTRTIVNPRGMRDMSFLLVPAYDMMAGPKWSEHNKQFVNDVCKDLNLDAVIIIMSHVSWTAAHTDKHSGEFIPEEIRVKIKTSTLVPLHKYHERLERVNSSEKPNVTLAFRAYESNIGIPALISVPLEMKNFDSIQKEVLTPMMKMYNDLTQMTLMRVIDDLKKTW